MKLGKPWGRSLLELRAADWSAAKPYHTAISLARGKLEVNPRDADAWAMVAAYYAMLDDKAHALESLQRALESAPGDPDVAFGPRSFTTISATPTIRWPVEESSRCWVFPLQHSGHSRISIRCRRIPPSAHW